MCAMSPNLLSAGVLASIIPDALILIRLDALYVTKPKIQIILQKVNKRGDKALVILAIIDDTFKPRMYLAKTLPKGCNMSMFNRKSRTQDLLTQFKHKSHSRVHYQLTRKPQRLAIVYYFILTLAQFLKSVKEVRTDTEDTFTRAVISTRNSLPTYFILFRQGALYFLGLKQLSAQCYTVIYGVVLILDLVHPSKHLWIPAVV
ncbi:hypothetical protein D9756_009130 [Leucocoprinus leucothites]|uniref:Uncharacterized protein n=1 Tax=Leucocoprinus leucothites TaxID=201217 RepID=A0A8H5D0K9_9AGAR|nr:hypothetical protein D9756_009130 [Leucoagaricus leucothites]